MNKTVHTEKKILSCFMKSQLLHRITEITTIITNI